MIESESFVFNTMKTRRSILGICGTILLCALAVLAENPTLLYESGHIVITPAGQHAGKLTIGDDGTLATATDISSVRTYVDQHVGASGSTVYFRTNASDVVGYSLATTNLTFLPFSVTNSFTGVTNGQYLTSYITSNASPNLALLPSGVYGLHDHIFGTAAGTTTVFGEIYTRSTNNVETFHFRTENSEVITATLLEQDMHAVYQGSAIDPTDRVVVKIRANHTGAAANVSLIKEGLSLSGLQFPTLLGVSGRSYFWGVLPDSTTNVLDFAVAGEQELNFVPVSSELYIRSTNCAPGKIISVIYNPTNAVTFSFISNWRWVGGTVPTTLTSGKRTIISLRCDGTTTNDVTAAKSDEP